MARMGKDHKVSQLVLHQVSERFCSFLAVDTIFLNEVMCKGSMHEADQRGAALVEERWPSEAGGRDRPQPAAPSPYRNSPRPFTAPAAGVDSEDSLIQLVPVVLNTGV